MASNLDVIKKTENKARIIVANATKEAQKIKNLSFEKSEKIKSEAFQDGKAEKDRIKADSLQKAQVEAKKILNAAGKKSNQLGLLLDKNLDRASDLIINKILEP